MKNSKSNDKNEKFFRELASLYVEKEGTMFRNELESAESTDCGQLDKKFRFRLLLEKNRRFIRRFSAAASLFVAAVIIAYVSLINPLQNTKSNDGAPDFEKAAGFSYEFIAEKLPSGYRVDNMEQDIGQTVYYIETDTDTSVVLTVEIAKGKNSEAYISDAEKIGINGSDAYLKLREDYTVLRYKKSDIIYEISTNGDYGAAIAICRRL